MNKTVSKFLLTGDTFIHDMHLRQSGFTDSACGPFTKHRKRIQKFRETGDLKHVHNNEFDKSCFAHDEAILIVNI